MNVVSNVLDSLGGICATRLRTTKNERSCCSAGWRLSIGHQVGVGVGVQKRTGNRGRSLVVRVVIKEKREEKKVGIYKASKVISIVGDVRRMVSKRSPPSRKDDSTIKGTHMHPNCYISHKEAAPLSPHSD